MDDEVTKIVEQTKVIQKLVLSKASKLSNVAMNKRQGNEKKFSPENSRRRKTSTPCVAIILQYHSNWWIICGYKIINSSILQGLSSFVSKKTSCKYKNHYSWDKVTKED